ncbi:MAG: hypothetical protein U0840_18855 [Gemmataceae bacterium]
MPRALIILLLTLSQVHAEPPACPPPTFDKKYCHTDILLVPKQHATTAPDWKLRDIEVGRIRVGPVLDFVEEKRCVTEMTLKQREVDQVVKVIESRPVTVTEPCGKCRTEYQPYEATKVVKIQVAEVVPVQREVIIRVPVLKPGPEAIVKKIQLDKTTVPAIEHRFDAVQTPSQLSVKVPVPLVIPPCPVCRPH